MIMRGIEPAASCSVANFHSSRHHVGPSSTHHGCLSFGSAANSPYGSHATRAALSNSTVVAVGLARILAAIVARALLRLSLRIDVRSAETSGAGRVLIP